MSENQVYVTKRTNLGLDSFVDVDAKTGTVSGYFAVFDNIDAAGDVIVKGAFKRSIDHNGPKGKNRIVHLREHNMMLPLAKPSELYEDTKGVRYVSTISKTSYGIDTLKLIEDKVLDENSVAFQTVRKSMKGNYREIQEGIMWEGSTVTLACNSEAKITDLKSMFDNNLDNAANVLFGRLENITKAIQKGTYQDETFQMLISQQIVVQKQIEQLLTEIKSTQFALNAPDSVPQKVDEAVQIKTLLSHFKLS